MDTGGFGWGGWTRTNTVLINSEVSYQLDHAPNRSGTAAENRSDAQTYSSGFWISLLHFVGECAGRLGHTPAVNLEG